MSRALDCFRLDVYVNLESAYGMNHRFGIGSFFVRISLLNALFTFYKMKIDWKKCRLFRFLD